MESGMERGCHNLLRAEDVAFILIGEEIDQPYRDIQLQTRGTARNPSTYARIDQNHLWVRVRGCRLALGRLA